MCPPNHIDSKYTKQQWMDQREIHGFTARVGDLNTPLLVNYKKNAILKISAI